MQKVQKQLSHYKLDGWLLYDFAGSNPLARTFLHIPDNAHLTRRFFYWIPATGTPIKIVHAIEPHTLDHLPGEKQIYYKWQTLETLLQRLLKGKKHVAMEYSPRGMLPYVSKVDGGVIDLVKSFGVHVESSANLLQQYTAVLDAEQLESHLYAADVLDKTAGKVWDMLRAVRKKGSQVSEYDVQQWIFQEISQAGCVMEGLPMCGIDAHSADPHYSPQKEGSPLLRDGNLVLIDLWCKKNTPGAVYADITRVAVIGREPSAKEQEIFTVVRGAQRAATDLVRNALAHGKEVKGWEADQASRQVIEKAGYGDFFIHRTGHNIYTRTHGPGANLDSLEMLDDRLLIPCTCFSVEPGIYLPGEFGIRLEYDIYIEEAGQIRITGGIQEQLERI